MCRTIALAVCLFLFCTLAPDDHGRAFAESRQALYLTSQITVNTTNPSTGSLLTTDIYYPASGSGVDPVGAPFASMVFARGYRSLPSEYTGVGTNLASYGFITAIPNFPSENLETRASDTQYLLSYLASENSSPSSLFYQRIDTNRLAVIGHSLGGITALIVASRDSRIKAAVALDPAQSSLLGLGTWNYQAEGPNISAPTLVVGGPSQTCNNSAGYHDIYRYITAEHTAKFVVANGWHCDYTDTTNVPRRTACYLLCGGSYNAQRTARIEGYEAAWFSYYLGLQTAYYSNLYGALHNQDIQTGVITATVQTAPRGWTATGQPGGIALHWQLSTYPAISGYDIYRKPQGGSYPGAPLAQVGRVTGFVDTTADAGQPYTYMLRSRDSAGNEHQPSNDASAQVVNPAPFP